MRQIWPPTGRNNRKRTKCYDDIVGNSMTKVHVYFKLDAFIIMDARDKIQILEIVLQFLTFDLHIYYFNLKAILVTTTTE